MEIFGCGRRCWRDWNGSAFARRKVLLVLDSVIFPLCQLANPRPLPNHQMFHFSALCPLELALCSPQGAPLLLAEFVMYSHR